MSFRRRLKNKRVPEGFEQIAEVVEDFEQQLKEAVVEEHEGKRKNESAWKIHRIHWEKNRFIYDLMYVRKVMSRELVGPNIIKLPIAAPLWSTLQQQRCFSGLLSQSAPEKRLVLYREIAIHKRHRLLLIALVVPLIFTGAV